MDMVLRTIEFMMGLLLLHLRFGLYETQEGRLQDRLAELWIQIDDFSPVLRQKVSRLLTETARLTLALFDHTFGAKPLSLQAITAAVLTVLASSMFAIGVASYASDTGEVIDLLVPVGIALALVGLWTVPHVKRYGVLSLILCLGIAVVLGMYIWEEHQLLPISSAFAAMVAFELLWLFIQRALLKFSMRGSSFLAALAFIAFPALTTASSILPLYFFMLYADTADFLQYFWLEVTLARFAALFIALPHLVIFAVLLVHATAWPLLARIVYGLERHNVFRERKILGPLGAVLIVHALAGSWFIEAIKLL